MLIDKTYFSGSLLIPQLSTTAVQAEVDGYIQEHENDYLLSILGYELFKVYGTNVNDQRIQDLIVGKEYTNRSRMLTKWRGLTQDLGTYKRSPIANYIYFMYMRDNATYTSGTGEKIAANQNAVNTSPRRKMTAAWNEMVRMNRELLEFLLSNLATYPEFTAYYSYGDAFLGWPQGYQSPYGGGDGFGWYGWPVGTSKLQDLLSSVNAFGI